MQLSSRSLGAGPAGRGSSSSRLPRRKLTIVNVAVPSKPPTSRAAKRSKVEIIKEKSDYLRHPLMEELANDLP